MDKFLELFDAFVSARDRMKAAPEGSKEESYALTDCANLWNDLVAAREAMREGRTA